MFKQKINRPVWRIDNEDRVKAVANKKRGAFKSGDEVKYKFFVENCRAQVMKMLNA